MNDPAQSAVLITRSLGNIATRAQLVERGVFPTTITAAVRLGMLRRVRRAHYATPEASFEAIAATRVGGRLCGLSAARSYGFWAGVDRTIHVAVPRNAGRLRTNLRPSESDDLTPDLFESPIELHWIDTPRHHECWRVRIEDCLRQVVAWSDAETAIACLDTALTSRAVTPFAIRRWFADEPPRSRVRASSARPGSQAGGESIVRQRLAPLGLVPQQQVSIAGVGRVDMVIENLVIEIDGETYHSGPESFEEDRRRDAELLARGYLPLRFTYTQVLDNWDWCLARILDALEQARAMRRGTQPFSGTDVTDVA